MERTAAYLTLATLFEIAWADEIPFPDLERDDRLAQCSPRASFLRGDDGEPNSGLITISRVGAENDTRHIAYIFTDPNQRKQGLAERLLEEYTRSADQRGLTLSATVAKKNLSVRRLFRKAGFVEVHAQQAKVADDYVWVERAPLALQRAHQPADEFTGDRAAYG